MRVFFEHATAFLHLYVFAHAHLVVSVNNARDGDAAPSARENAGFRRKLGHIYDSGSIWLPEVRREERRGGRGMEGGGRVEVGKNYW